MIAKKKGRLEVIHYILSLVMKGNNSVLITPLMRASRLSSARFSEYLAELIDKGFIREVTDKKAKRYLSLTDKGFAFLEKYRMIQGFIDEFEL